MTLFVEYMYTKFEDRWISGPLKNGFQEQDTVYTALVLLAVVPFFQLWRSIARSDCLISKEQPFFVVRTVSDCCETMTHILTDFSVLSSSIVVKMSGLASQRPMNEALDHLVLNRLPNLHLSSAWELFYFRLLLVAWSVCTKLHHISLTLCSH